MKKIIKKQNRELVKIFGIVLFILISINIKAQNVGIGTSTPSEKLDVVGSINLTEKLKFDNDSGQPGDLLIINNNGDPAWGYSGNYNFSRVFNSLNAQTFIIPSGVTEIFIESWGPGGGGALFAGAGSGAYESYLINCTNLSSILIDNGEGGTNATTETGSGLTGENNVITLNYTTPITLTVEGGNGANPNVAGGRKNLTLIGLSINILAHYGLPGNTGKPVEVEYYFNGNELLRTVYSNADGGAGIGIFSTPNYGSTFYENNSGSFFNVSSVIDVNSYNHGGSGGYRSSVLSFGFDGGDGITIIRWN